MYNNILNGLRTPVFLVDKDNTINYINEIGDWPDQLDLIFHSGIDVWKTEIQKIKDEYPKPS